LKAGALDRLVTYGLPVLSVVVAALVLLGPGAQRPVQGVRVRGLAFEGAQVLALRLEGVRRSWSVDDGLPLDGLRVEATAGGRALPAWEGGLGEDGVGEARLVSAEPLAGAVELRVTRRGAALGEGRLTLRPGAAWRVDGGQVHGTTEGAALALEVRVPRGQLAAPFPEAVEVRVRGVDGGLAGGATVRAEVSGAAIAPARASVDEHGVARFVVKPHLHTVPLTLKAQDGAGREATWEGYLPVRPGAMWVAPDAGTLTVRSQARRPQAYVSVEGPTGRVLGAVLPLRPGADGVSTGSLGAQDLAALGALPGPLFAVVAADPYEQGLGTSAWPLAPSEGRLAVSPLELFVDGVPAMEAREVERAGRARKLGIAVIGLAALVEVLWLAARSRGAQRRLEAHLARTSAGLPGADRARLTEAAREHPVLYLAAFMALVLLAFTLFAAVTTFR
jgi:hypothetical protein